MILALHSTEMKPEQKVYKSGKKPVCVLEKKLILETLGLLKTTMYTAGQTFTQQYVYSVCKLTKTILTDKKLEAEFTCESLVRTKHLLF